MGYTSTMRICDVGGCGRPAKARGWCTMHYARWRRAGDPTSSKWDTDLRGRISAAVAIDENGCWIWQRYLNPTSGYGLISVRSRRLYAHRVSWEAFTGEKIPAGFQVDHLCRVRSCVNPEHLEPVTSRTNLLRGNTVTARAAAATHCPQGHPYDSENTYVAPNGNRQCRICRRERRREWSARKRAKS